MVEIRNETWGSGKQSNPFCCRSRRRAQNALLSQLKPLGRVLLGIDAELLHSRKKRGPIDAHACGRALSTTDAALGLRKSMHNLFALLLSAFIRTSLVSIENMDGFLHNSCNVLQARILRGGSGSFCVQLAKR